MVGKSRLTVVGMENNTINNNTKINFHVLPAVNLLLPTPVYEDLPDWNIFTFSFIDLFISLLILL